MAYYTIEQMRKIKETEGYTYEEISQGSGIPYGTVQKIFLGVTEKPRRSTLIALSEYFETFRSDKYYSLPPSSPRVEEPPAEYHASKEPASYTVKDYDALPPESRVELLDGKFYDMASPDFIHQGLSGFLFYTICDYIKTNKRSCRAFTAPFDVFIDKDEYSALQPDVFVVCDSKKIIRRGIFGAPDLIIEILSPSTARYDLGRKCTKYMESGVREYWVVDPRLERVIVYSLGEDTRVSLYTFDDYIPVGIYNGELAIHLKEEFEELTKFE